MEERDWWQITEFAEEISKVLQMKTNDLKASVHYNTIDKWFKALETKRVHYVNRAAGEKVYDKQDLVIGSYIAERRKENRYKLDVIYEYIKKDLPVRDFPDDFKDESPVTIDETLMQNRIAEGLNKILAQQFSIYEEKLSQQMNKLMDEKVTMMLPEPISKEEERAKRMDDTIIRMRAEMKLEELAIEKWNQLPEGDRTKKVGLFRKEENLLKREHFIRTYKRENLEKVLAAAYETNRTTSDL